jgi:dienelactone hydrolase
VNVADLKALDGLDQWPKLRKKIETSVKSILQMPGSSSVDPQFKVMDEFQESGYTRRRINYFVDDWSRVSAWLLVPDGAEEDPAIICMHRQTAVGKDEPAGLAGTDPTLGFAKHYAQLGYVTLAPDCIAAGERIFSRCEAYDTKTFYKEHGKYAVLGKMLHDHMRCIDILCDMREVDPGRIGVMGHGLGGMNALLVTAFDERVRACVSSCGITSIAKEANADRWAPESGLVLAPKMRAAMKGGKTPFDWDEVMALCAPIPVQLITSLNDEFFPHAETCKDMVETARTVYSLLGEKDGITVQTHNEKHSFPLEAQDAADSWIDRWL